MTFTPNTLIKILAKQTDYTPGVGTQSSYVPVTYQLVPGGKVRDAYMVEWRSAFGSDVLTAEQLSIKSLATVRMGYSPGVVKALGTTDVKILLNGDEGLAYKPVGAPDNMRMEGRWLEFKVQRWDSK